MAASAAAAPGSAERQARGGAASAIGNAVFKSGPLFISSKGIGWKSWKKRWFILTRTSLVFFKNDPSTLPQRSGEVNLTLGGIDLNNSGSVVVREDKRLLTVLFPDGRDGRAFTLNFFIRMPPFLNIQAESSKDLFEWKTSLEEALAQAPNAALLMGHNGIFRNDTTDVYEEAIPNWREKRPTKSLVVGRPILLALEDIDGSPSFLEKALCFLEKHGIKVEGILRQAADVEEVDRRLQEYEQGRTEFAPEEDAHVIGDCVKHVLRELPSSPVPASCCTALLEAFRLDIKESRIKSMRAAISETFPEPTRRLLQRILKMMHTVASHTAENRMTPSAVAACMAPLLLRPLLSGECELEDDFDMSDDSAAQLIAAANAANSAQGIVTTLLEEYESIFNDEHFRCSLSPDSQTGDSGSEESTDDETVDIKDNGFHDAENDVDQELDDAERILNGKLSETSACVHADLHDYKQEVNGNDSDAELFVEDNTFEPNVNLNDTPLSRLIENGKKPSNLASSHETPLSVGEILSSLDAGVPLPGRAAEYSKDRLSSKPNGIQQHVKRTNLWGRSNARKGQRSELVDPSSEEELAIQRLEVMKNDLQVRIAKEARSNAILQASLERRKQALHERRVALEQNVSRLQEQLQAERDLRAALEIGLSMYSSQFSSSHSMDSKVTEIISKNTVQTGFDRTVAFCNQEKQRNEESLPCTSHWRSIKQHVLSQDSSRPFSRKHSSDTSLSDSMEASTSVLAEGGPLLVNIARTTEQGVEYGRPPTVPSSTLVELTTRLDFFKERRSQLMEQLHSLDLGHGSASHGFPYKSSSPWNNPR
ncbi:Rho GTPase-activating protein 7 [Zea mays]|uniref:Rho GTPase-activating protein 7 n=1 Tax=Zea mays TaxID=4577 RepID=A0A1D6F313_MAIZE|nr:Rho GTPase-activating protein 7 [Zea mays]